MMKCKHDIDISKNCPDCGNLPNAVRSGSSDCSSVECPKPDWLIMYEDTECPPEIYTEEGPARKRFEAASLNWNCHLFKRVSSR